MIQATGPNVKSSQVLNKVLPLVIGYFALSVPSGLSLYWFTNNILSTLQQIWLQKLGGAKNPLRQVLDDNVKNVDLMQVQKSVSNLNSTKIEEARKDSKLTSEGPRPGDKFKQLMEQEAKKKQQREEEKRKAEEAAAKANNHEQTVEGGNQVVNDLVKNSQSVADDTDPSISGVINGNGKDLEGNQNSTSTSDTANDEGSAHLNAVNKKNLEKESREVLSTRVTTNKQAHGEDSDRVSKD